MYSKIQQQMHLLLSFREKRTRDVIRRLSGQRLDLGALEKKGRKSSADFSMISV